MGDFNRPYRPLKRRRRYGNIPSRSPPLRGPVAQGIEQRFPGPCVAGSNPARPAINFLEITRKLVLSLRDTSYYSFLYSHGAYLHRTLWSRSSFYGAPREASGICGLWSCVVSRANLEFLQWVWQLVFTYPPGSAYVLLDCGMA